MPLVLSSRGNQSSNTEISLPTAAIRKNFPYHWEEGGVFTRDPDLLSALLASETSTMLDLLDSMELVSKPKIQSLMLVWAWRFCSLCKKFLYENRTNDILQLNFKRN